jgi:hypothetical protein
MAIPPISGAPSSAAVSPESPLPFSTRVGGKDYSAEVIRAGEQYIAKEPEIFGAEASGTSRQAAEEALAARIDCLV